jgi:hypothetical protein
MPYQAVLSVPDSHWYRGTASSAVPKWAVYVLSKSSEFTSLYGLSSDGCALVRPDGYVAVRQRSALLVGRNRASLGDRIWPIHRVRFIQRTGKELGQLGDPRGGADPILSEDLEATVPAHSTG